MTSCQLLDRPTGPRKGMRIMKRIFALALIVCVGLECGCGSSAKQQQQTNLAASSLVGDWTGTLTGTNFGTTPLNLNIQFCPASYSALCGTSVYLGGWDLGEDNNWVVGGSNCGESTELYQGSPGSSGPITINGSQFGVSYSGNTGPGQGNIPVTFSINGTVAADNQSMSGNISFSFPPCGTAANPWTGTFTATLQQ
jgi:hypothetical protein